MKRKSIVLTFISKPMPSKQLQRPRLQSQCTTFIRSHACTINNPEARRILLTSKFQSEHEARGTTSHDQDIDVGLGHNVKFRQSNENQDRQFRECLEVFGTSFQIKVDISGLVTGILAFSRAVAIVGMIAPVLCVSQDVGVPTLHNRTPRRVLP